MSEFESTVNQLVEGRRLTPLQVAVLRAAEGGASGRELQDAYVSAGGTDDSMAMLMIYHRLGDWAKIPGAERMNWESGRYQTPLGLLTRMGTPRHYVYLLTDKGREALRSYDEGGDIYVGGNEPLPSILQAAVLWAAMTGATRGELLNAYVKAGGTRNDMSLASMFPKISDWIPDAKTSRWKRPVKSWGWLTRRGKLGSYIYWTTEKGKEAYRRFIEDRGISLGSVLTKSRLKRSSYERYPW